MSTVLHIPTGYLFKAISNTDNALYFALIRKYESKGYKQDYFTGHWPGVSYFFFIGTGIDLCDCDASEFLLLE